MLPDFRLETYFSKWEFTAQYHLCASDTDTFSVNEIVAMAGEEDRRAWDELRLGYTETFGAPSLRTSIATTYDNISEGELLTFAGAEEGIFTAMQVLLGAVDHAVVITPNYQAAETIPRSVCDVTGVALNPDKNWDLDLNEIANATQSNTKVISINFPHNPTGKVISRATFDDLVAFARERGIYLFSDEVYRLLERDESIRLPQIADVYERGLSLNVMSKAYGLPGLRIGWIACRDQELLSKMERVKHYLSICNSGPSEVLAQIALNARQKILKRNRGIIDENLPLFNEFFEKHADRFEWSVPDGGCIGYPQYTGNDGVESFCENLVEETGVLLLPASVYRSALNTTPTDRFRIGYGRRNAEEPLAILSGYLDRFFAEKAGNF